MNISLIAVDLDGTLLVSGKKPAPEGAELLRCASRRGVRVVLATAREPSSTRAFCAELGLNDPMICFGGAQVWSAPDGEIWASATIPRETGLAIAEYADARGWELMTTIGSVTYLKQRSGQQLGQVTPTRTILETNTAAFLANPGPPHPDLVRILVFDPDAIVGLTELCQAQFSQDCRTDLFFSPEGQPESLGIFPVESDKGAALRLVLDRLCISSREVMAIGDNLVDLPMFEVAGFPVAMGNAPARVKQRAAAVAPTNEQEGVAWAIRKFVLEAALDS